MITVALLQSTESISMAVLTIRAVIKYGLFTDVVDILKRGKSKWDICDKEWEI